MKTWRINVILRDSGNPPYTEELIRTEFQRHMRDHVVNADVFVMDVREVIPETFQPIVPKERIHES